LVGDRGVHRIRFRFERGRLLVEDRPDLRLVSATSARVVLRDGGLQQAFAVARHGDELYVDTTAGSVRYTVRDPLPDPTHEAAPGSLVAPMPGSVVRLDVSEGDNVRSGQTIILLEAMKMQHPITAPVDGTVAKLLVSQGDQVDNGTVLAVIDSAASA
jgi:propionyl-CoA carboxylase alpha chain